MEELFKKIAQLAVEVRAAETKVKTDNDNISIDGRSAIRAYMEKLLHCIAPIKAAAASQYEDCEFTTHDVQFRLNEARIECVLYSGEAKDDSSRPVGIAFSFGVNERRLSHHGGFSADSFNNAEIIENKGLIDKFVSIPVAVIEKRVAEWCMDRLRVRLQTANANIR